MLWAALLVLAAPVFAQDEPSVVIRSTTSLVQVRVVATGAQGQSVTNLRQDDFQVQDNRKPQPITLFAADLAAALSPGASPASTHAAAPQPAETYAVTVLDWVNTPYPDRFRVEDQVLALLKSFQPRQKTAIYLLDLKAPRFLTDFESDREELVRAVQESATQPGEVEGARFGTAAGRRPSIEEQIFDWNQRITDSFTAFETIAARLGAQPGRKSLVWMSNAFPLVLGAGVIPGARQADIIYYQAVERLLARLNRADIAFYGVEARGLSITSRSFVATMMQFAERTGGTVFHDRNDIGEGLRLALEDQAAGYVLGFHVPADAQPGPHEILVRVKRPGVRLRYRESYELADAPAK
jgi:VWFA-related protein